MLTTLLEDAGTEETKAVRALSTRYLAFVSHALDARTGRFRNFFSYSRRWTEERGSEDSHGRALWALGTLVGRAREPDRQSHGGSLFQGALPAVIRFTSPRAWAYSLLGIDEYLRAFQGDRSVQAVRQDLAGRLLAMYESVAAPSWPWFEDRLTYCNARLSQALLVSGAGMEHEPMKAVGLRSLEWLVAVQTSDDGCFAPIGSNGFYVRGGPRASYDQQPVEACAMVSACREAHRLTGQAVWADHARRAFDWFLGHNVLKRPLHDAATGGCRDGLHADRVNENQGAEATLSYLLALLEMRAADRVELALAVPFEARA